MSHTVFTVNDRMRNSHREYDTILALHLNENPLESKFSDVWSFLVCCIGTRQLVVDIEDVGYKKSPNRLFRHLQHIANIHCVSNTYQQH